MADDAMPEPPPRIGQAHVPTETGQPIIVTQQALSGSAYRVQLLPHPVVIDANGFAVANGHVIEIGFPGETIQTLLGPVNRITGTGMAKILIGDVTIRGVPLC